MTSYPEHARTHPAAWVPTLYFAEGIPFFAVSLIAGILYKRMGLPNDVIALYTSWLLLPWSLKPLWSPLIEMFKTKKYFVVLLEGLCGLSLALIALCLPLPGYFRYTLVLFVLVAVCSSTHDIAADGLYIAGLSHKQQAAYAGWQGGFYNVARFFSQGGLIIFAGYLEARTDVPHAWMAIFLILGVVLIALSLYHSRALPAGGVASESQSFAQIKATFADVVVSFFRKPEDPLPAALHPALSRRRRSGSAHRAAVPGRPAVGGRTGPLHRPVRHDLRHVRHGGLHRRQRAGRILHVVAGAAARAVAVDLRHESAEPGVCVPERGHAAQSRARSRRRWRSKCSAMDSDSWA